MNVRTLTMNRRTLTMIIPLIVVYFRMFIAQILRSFRIGDRLKQTFFFLKNNQKSITTLLYYNNVII